MDEVIDIVDEFGKETGKTCLKSEAHLHGYFHKTVHVWLYTVDHKILLQKRALTKRVFPGLWDISVAGHVGTGEAIINAVKREVWEEIGYVIPHDSLFKIGTRKQQITHDNGIIDNEIHHVFVAKLTIPIEQLVIDKNEVDSVTLFDLEILTKTKNFENILLPKFHLYYCDVHAKITALI